MGMLKASNFHSLVDIIHFIIKVNSIKTLRANLIMKVMAFKLIIIVMSIDITTMTNTVNIAYHIDLPFAFIITKLTF